MIKTQKVTQSPKTWTQFWDMHSGGSLKTDYSHIYIEAYGEEDAIRIFQEEFDRNPYNVTCDCCGEDYSLDTDESLEQVTGYQRGCRHIHQKNENGYYIEQGEEVPAGFNVSDPWDKYQTLEEYSRRPDVLILRLAEDSV